MYARPVNHPALSSTKWWDQQNATNEGLTGLGASKIHGSAAEGCPWVRAGWYNTSVVCITWIKDLWFCSKRLSLSLSRMVPHLSSMQDMNQRSKVLQQKAVPEFEQNGTTPLSHARHESKIHGVAAEGRPRVWAEWYHSYVTCTNLLLPQLPQDDRQRPAHRKWPWPLRLMHQSAGMPAGLGLNYWRLFDDPRPERKHEVLSSVKSEHINTSQCKEMWKYCKSLYPLENWQRTLLFVFFHVTPISFLRLVFCSHFF